MALTIHFKDGTIVTNPNWQAAQESETDGNFIDILGGGTPGAKLALVPTVNVQYIDLNS